MITRRSTVFVHSRSCGRSLVTPCYLRKLISCIPYCMADQTAPQGLSLPEEQVRKVAHTTVQRTLAGPRGDWCREFVIESVVSDVTEAGVPQDAAEAMSRFSDLLNDSYEVTPEDVEEFCSVLVQQLFHLQEEEQAALEPDMTGCCELCEREMPLTKHHLIPRDVHKEYKKKGLSFDQLQAGLMVCRPCHSAIHRAADNKVLAAQLSTREALLQHPEIAKFVGWARKQRVTDKGAVGAPGFRYPK